MLRLDEYLTKNSLGKAMVVHVFDRKDDSIENATNHFAERPPSCLGRCLQAGILLLRAEIGVTNDETSGTEGNDLKVRLGSR